MPHLAVDPVLAASAIVLALQVGVLCWDSSPIRAFQNKAVNFLQHCCIYCIIAYLYPLLLLS